MSLILDALGRSQRDQAKPLETLQSSTVENNTPPGAAKLWWALGMALLVAIACIALLLWERADRADPVVTPVNPMPSSPVAEQTPASAPEQKVVVVKRSAEAFKAVTREEPALLPQQLPQQLPKQLPQQRPVPEDVKALYDSAPAPATSKTEQELASSSPVADPVSVPAPTVNNDSSQDTSLDVEALVAQAKARLEQQEAEIAHRAPWITDLSQQTRDSIPSVYYAQHLYDTLASNRRVVLNNQTLRENGRLRGAGITVKEILPDSVILEYSGTMFRLRSLNSWVNL